MTGAQPDDRRYAPAAARNRDRIAEEVDRLAPSMGRALEIASGSGEHVIEFAARLPGISWQPSDPDPDQRASISAWTHASGRDNISPPRAMVVGRPGGAAHEARVDLVIAINLLHLIPVAAMEAAFDGFARILTPGGVLIYYGPFLRDGRATSAGDEAFDAELRGRDPTIGYKDLDDVITRLTGCALAHGETVEMPANNLLLAFRQSGD